MQTPPERWSISLVARALLLCLAWGVSAPPALVGQDGGEVMPAHLEHWWVHQGDLPNLRGAGESLDAQQLQEALRAAAGGHDSRWQEVLLPWHVDPPRGRLSEGGNATVWLISEFSVDPLLRGRGLTLWFNSTEALAKVYMNGELLGTRGDTSEGMLSMRSPLPPTFALAASQLSLSASNTHVIAVSLSNPLLSVQVLDAKVMDPHAAPEAVFFGRTLGLMLNAGVCALLLVVIVYFLAWYVGHREEYENLFLVIGLCSFVAVFVFSWLPWLPASGALFAQVGMVCLPLSNFLTVFFQHRYRIHMHRAFPYGLLAWAVLGLLGAMVLQPRQMIMLVTGSLPITQVGFIYGFYLNWRGLRAGNSDARTVMWGYGLYAACIGIDMTYFMLYNVSAVFVSSFGMAALAVSIVVSLTRRFSGMEITRQQVVEDLRRRQDLQDFLVTQIAEAASAIEITSGHILTSASQQQFGATEQSTSVEETRRTMETLLSSGRTITMAAHDVLRNAEMTQQHNHAVAQRIGESSNHSRRISEILDIIRDIANKTELLALNAALEGSRAGEAGRGFALVATQMQRLAENVMSAVADIKDLTADIRKVSGATQATTLQAAQLASETTESAHKIGLIIQEQQVGTEQVTRAMDDVAKIATQTAQSGQTTLERTQTLIEKARSLRALVEQYRTGSSIVRQEDLRA